MSFFFFKENETYLHCKTSLFGNLVGLFCFHYISTCVALFISTATSQWGVNGCLTIVFIFMITESLSDISTQYFGTFLYAGCRSTEVI